MTEPMDWHSMDENQRAQKPYPPELHPEVSDELIAVGIAELEQIIKGIRMIEDGSDLLIQCDRENMDMHARRSLGMGLLRIIYEAKLEGGHAAQQQRAQFRETGTWDGRGA